MTLKKIELEQRKIKRSLANVIHPDNTIAFEMSKRYRELEQLKLEI